jgi:hypothetical protein|tara:strand:- start:836 stop:2236 length:1401 start_codon:yes stop_codon:yes gene_type:complete
MKKNYYVREIKVSEVQLDQKNPRFPPVENQREAIQAMLKDQGQKIVNLASEIYQNGLNPSSRLILFKEGGKYIDGDGNRRITALKLLETPSLAGSEPRIKKKFDSLLKKRGTVPSEVDCVIFKSRDDAKHWISINHNGPQDGKGQIAWNSEQKDRFEGNFTIGLQALDKLLHENLIYEHDKSLVNKTTLDRLLSYRKVKELLAISKSGDHFSFGRMSELKKVVLALREKKVDVVYTAEKGFGFVQNILTEKSVPDNPIDQEYDNQYGVGDKDADSNEDADADAGGYSYDRSDSDGNTDYGGGEKEGSVKDRDSAETRTRRKKSKGLTVFGGSLSLKAGHINNLYRDIEYLYNSYQDDKKNDRKKFSEDFIVIFRMSLRMLAEAACKDIDGSKQLASFLKDNFDKAKRSLNQDEKTSLSNQSVEKNKIVQLFHTGAHEYNNSKNEEQALALSIILGAILKITHGKRS